MSTKSEEQDSPPKRPKNKATMDQPQEEFIEPESAHVEHDKDHGSEVNHPGNREEPLRKADR